MHFGLHEYRVEEGGWSGSAAKPEPLGGLSVNAGETGRGTRIDLGDELTDVERREGGRLEDEESRGYHKSPCH